MKGSRVRTKKILLPRLLKKSVVVPLVAGATAILVATSASASPVAPAPRMSPATLANGILFDQGPAAGYLSTFFHSTLHGAAEVRLEQAVDTDLAGAGPAANAFAEEVQSGNRIEVEQALNWVAEQLYNTMTRLYGAAVAGQLIAQADSLLTNTPEKASGDNPDAIRSTLNVVYKVGQVVVAAQAAAAVETAIASVVVVLTVAVFFFAPDSPNAQAQLSAQEFVNAIAVHLKAA
jgi:hypothetical protein